MGYSVNNGEFYIFVLFIHLYFDLSRDITSGQSWLRGGAQFVFSMLGGVVICFVSELPE